MLKKNYKGILVTLMVLISGYLVFTPDVDEEFMKNLEYKLNTNEVPKVVTDTTEVKTEVHSRTIEMNGVEVRVYKIGKCSLYNLLPNNEVTLYHNSDLNIYTIQ